MKTTNELLPATISRVKQHLRANEILPAIELLRPLTHKQLEQAASEIGVSECYNSKTKHELWRRVTESLPQLTTAGRRAIEYLSHIQAIAWIARTAIVQLEDNHYCMSISSTEDAGLPVGNTADDVRRRLGDAIRILGEVPSV